MYLLAAIIPDLLGVDFSCSGCSLSSASIVGMMLMAVC